MAYIYCHFKADNNDPFYVGIGNKIDRAYKLNHHSRTIFHRNITKKHGVKISIIKETKDWETACFWEKAWIKALKNEGFKLANLTNGGDGTLGVPSYNKKSVLCLETGEIFNSVTEAACKFNIDVTTVADVCHLKYRSAKGFHFIFSDCKIDESNRYKIIKEIELKCAERRKKVIKNKNYFGIVDGKDSIGRSAAGPKKLSRKVLSIFDNIEFNSASEAARYYNVSKSAIIELCLGKNGRKTAGGHKFRYVEGP